MENELKKSNISSVDEMEFVFVVILFIFLKLQGKQTFRFQRLAKVRVPPQGKVSGENTA
jgi:hypothetical protein